MGRNKTKQKPKPKKALSIAQRVLRATLFAMVCSGILTYFLFPVQWKTSFAYQYQPDPSSEPRQESDFFKETLSTQVAVLKSDAFLEMLRSHLNEAGISFTSAQVSRALHVSNPPNTALIEILVQTPHKKTTQQLAQLLDTVSKQFGSESRQAALFSQKANLEALLKRTEDKLQAGDKRAQDIVSTIVHATGNPFASNPDIGAKSLSENYQMLTTRLQDVEADIEAAETQYNAYQTLLNSNEKNLIAGVVLGDDPLLAKMTEQLAMAETESGILNVGLTPEDAGLETPQNRIKQLKAQLERQKQKVLQEKMGQSTPIIQDSLRQEMVSEMVSKRLKLQAAQKTKQTLEKQRTELLKSLATYGDTTGELKTWLFRKTSLLNTVNQLEKQLDTLESQVQQNHATLKLLGTLPEQPSQNYPAHEASFFFLASSLILGCAASTMPYLRKRTDEGLFHTSLLAVLENILQAKGQQVILLLPVMSSGHLNTSLQLGGLLNQFGRDALVIDADLKHRWLSRKLSWDATNGVFEHLLNADLKQAHTDPLSGAKVLPLEVSMDADQVVEFSQVVQRLPGLWGRWSSSVIILDMSQWHEAYHQLLPLVSQVIFYVPPESSAKALLPQVFYTKYNVPVSIIEIQPEI